MNIRQTALSCGRTVPNSQGDGNQEVSCLHPITSVSGFFTQHFWLDNTVLENLKTGDLPLEMVY